MLKNVIEDIVKQLVEEPNLVSVSFTESDEKLAVSVKVAQNDLKRVIGREGRIARALQSFVSAFHPHTYIDVSVDVAI